MNDAIVKKLRSGKAATIALDLRLYPVLPTGEPGFGLHVRTPDGRMVLSRDDAADLILALAATLKVDDAGLSTIETILTGVTDAKAD